MEWIWRTVRGTSRIRTQSVNAMIDHAHVSPNVVWNSSNAHVSRSSTGVRMLKETNVFSQANASTGHCRPPHRQSRPGLRATSQATSQSPEDPLVLHVIAAAMAPGVTTE